MAGFISAERIEAGSIATSKVTSDFGQQLVISANPAIIGLNEQIAPEFSTSTTYTAGQIVRKDGKIYVFTTDHPAGTWNPNHVTETDVVSQIEILPDEVLTTVENYLGDETWVSVHATGITAYVADNAYGIQSGVDITADGIEVSGGSYVLIKSGGLFAVDSGNFAIDASGNVSMTGAITANSGTIGGITVDDDYGIYTNGKTSPTSTKTGFLISKDGAIYLGAYNSTAGACPFQVTSAGILTANGANISGTINAGAGSEIGGWTLAANRLYSGTGNNYVALDSGTSDVTYAIWAGNSSPASAKFKVSRSGEVTATAGEVGGWTIGSDYIGNASSKATSTVGMVNGSNSTDIVFWAGGAYTGTGANAPTFWVKKNGTATLGGWTISATDIHSGSGANYVAMSSDPNSTYAIWAGSETPATAKFSVQRDGTTTITQLKVANETTGTTTINLSDKNATYPMWKLSYGTVKSATFDADDYCTSLTFSSSVSGHTTVNFNSAASVDFDTETLWSNGSKTLTLTNGKTKTINVPDPSANDWSNTYIGNKTEAVTVLIAGKAFNATLDVTDAYNAGWGAAKGVTGNAFVIDKNNHTVSIDVPSSTVGSTSAVTATVTLDPSSWDGGDKTVTAKVGGTSVVSTTVSIPGLSGLRLGEKVSGTSYTWGIHVDIGDTTKDGSLSLSNVYTDARTGYTQGTFTLASVTLQGASKSCYVANSSGNLWLRGDTANVTLQGDSQSVYIVASSGGSTYYKAGTAVTYYQGNGTRYASATRYPAGTKTTYYRGNGSRLSAVTRYKAGTATTYYQGNGAKYSEATRYDKQGSYSPTATGTLYYAGGQSAGSGNWFRVNSSINYLYTLKTAETVLIPDASGDKVLRGDSVSVTPQGASESVYAYDASGNYYLRGESVEVTPIGTGATVLVASNTGSYYLRGDTVSVTPIDTNNKLEHLTATTRYKAGSSATYYQGNGTRLSSSTLYQAGSTVTDTYYTKS